MCNHNINTKANIFTYMIEDAIINHDIEKLINAIERIKKSESEGHFESSQINFHNLLLKAIEFESTEIVAYLIDSKYYDKSKMKNPKNDYFRAALITGNSTIIKILDDESQVVEIVSYIKGK